MQKFLLFVAILGMLACGDGIIIYVTPTPETLPTNIPYETPEFIDCHTLQLTPGSRL